MGGRMAKKSPDPKPRGRRPNEQKTELPPRLNIYWTSADLRDWAERHIATEQAAGRMPMRTEDGRRYGVTHLIMGLVEKYRATVEKRTK